MPSKAEVDTRIIKPHSTGELFSVTDAQGSVMEELERNFGLTVTSHARSGERIDLKDRQVVDIPKGTRVVSVDTVEGDRPRTALFWQTLNTTLGERANRAMELARVEGNRSGMNAIAGVLLTGAAALWQLKYRDLGGTVALGVTSTYEYMKAIGNQVWSRASERVALSLNPQLSSRSRLFGEVHKPQLQGRTVGAPSK